MPALKDPWDEKYRPKSLSEYVFQNNQERVAFENIVKSGIIPNHLLLSGVQGTGKSTLAMILLKELNIDPIDIKIVKASDQNSVDVMREEIKGFVGSYPVGDYKVVLLEEADRISLSGQDILRHLLDDYKQTSRFILTGNYEHRITGPIKSRLQQYRFKAHDKNDIAEMVARILLTEKVKFTLETLDKYVDLAYPDIRKTIVLLQQNTEDGVLMEPGDQKETGDYKIGMFDYLEKGQWVELRKHLCEAVAMEEWEDVYRFLYENLHKAPVFGKNQSKWEDAIVNVAEYLYRNTSVADPEINFAACIIRLQQILETESVLEPA